MGGGLMQLVAYGAQDIYLSGNPQITFFKVVYRRHTNFAIESIRQTISGNSGRNITQECIISRNGDLIHKIWIGESHSTEFEIYKYIDKAEIKIGGQLIDKQTSDWNNIWLELSTPESKVNGYRSVFSPCSGANSGNYFWYPLNFWFCRNIGLCLPLIALQYHEITLDITWGKDSIVNSPEIWIDYIFLDTDERRKFSQVSHEYLIEQVQYQESPGDTSIINLNFNHPIKELIWVNNIISSDSRISYIPIGCNKDVFDKNKMDVFKNADKTSCELKLNGHDRFGNRNLKYFKTVQPLCYHTRCPAVSEEIKETFYVDISASQTITPIFNITHALRIKHINFTGSFGIDSTLTANSTFDIGYTNINSLIESDLNSASFTPIAGTIGLDSSDFNPYRNVTFQLIPDSIPIIHENHKLYIKKDITKSQFTMKGYFTILYESLPRLFFVNSSSPSLANIYCYSFSLNPEEHQPSGTCNFSRIDSKKLIFNDNPGNKDTTIKIFAVNYNILRINSGRGGIAYSN